MVPRQFFGLMSRRKDEILRNEFGPAMITATIVNVFSKKRYSAKHFMPSYEEPPRKEAHWTELLDKVKVIHRSLGGA
jgi:hypothetical protein